MTGNVASLIALVPMLFHSIFGCCWHHDHARLDHDHQHAAVAVTTESHSSSDQAHESHAGCSFHGSSTSEDEGERHAEDHSNELPCEEDPCAYSGIVITTVSQLVSLEMWGLAQFAMVDLPVVQPSRLTAWDQSRDWSLSHSARERRALSQVWLI